MKGVLLRNFEPSRKGKDCRTLTGNLELPKVPRVVELLRKAIEWQILLESGEIVNKADIARQEGITRARVTQVMGVLRPAPEIQERILSMPDGDGRPSLTERMLRPFGTIADQRDQIREFQRVLP